MSVSCLSFVKTLFNLYFFSVLFIGNISRGQNRGWRKRKREKRGDKEEEEEGESGPVRRRYSLVVIDWGTPQKECALN